jgi:hypothetical protein
MLSTVVSDNSGQWITGRHRHPDYFKLAWVSVDVQVIQL